MKSMLALPCALLLILTGIASCGDDRGGGQGTSLPHHGQAAGRPALLESLERRLRQFIDTLQRAGGHHTRAVFTDGNAWTERYLLDAMSTPEVRAVRQEFIVPRRSGGEGRIANIVTEVPGGSDSIVVIVAHFDATAARDHRRGAKNGEARAPGANDNATGVAAMIELLRLAASHKGQLRYSVLFVAVNAEERHHDYRSGTRRDAHHFGSRHAARLILRSGRPVKCAITLDMIGWHPRGDTIRLFAGPGAGVIARELVAAMDPSQGHPSLGGPITGCPNSDNESFDRVSIPSVLIMEACRPWRPEGSRPRNRWYHTQADTLEHVRITMVAATVRWLWSWLRRAPT